MILGRTYGLTPRIVFEAKVGLRRISEILRYAATFELADVDPSVSDFKEHYDPEFVNKAKAVALLNVLKLQIEKIEDRTFRDRIQTKIDNLEGEVRRPKPRWGVIITSLFVLLGVFADLKSLKPDIYQRPYEIVSEILATIHEEGKATPSKTPTLLLGPRPDRLKHPTPPNDAVIDTSAAFGRRRDNEI